MSARSVLRLVATAALLHASGEPAHAQLPSMRSGQGGRMPCGSCVEPKTVAPNARLAGPSEPGDPLVIVGTIYQADGVSPAAGITLFLYHTDARGHYNERDDAYDPRIYGFVRTDSQGRYEFATIRPGPYPGRTVPAHIHAHVYGPNLGEYFIPEYRFLDDPLVPEEERGLPERLGRFSPTVVLAKGSDGVWRGTRDIRLR